MSLLHLDSLQPVFTRQTGQNGGTGEEHLVQVFLTEMVKVLMAHQDDVRFVPLRDLEGISVDYLRSGDPERVMSNTREVQGQQFHGTVSL